MLGGETTICTETDFCEFWPQLDEVEVAVTEFPIDNKGRHQKKRNVFFRALPESPKPPNLPWPQFGQLGPFFGRQKRRFARMTEIFFDNDNDGFNDNYDDNFGNFDDNYDKNH